MGHGLGFGGVRGSDIWSVGVRGAADCAVPRLIVKGAFGVGFADRGAGLVWGAPGAWGAPRPLTPEPLRRLRHAKRGRLAPALFARAATRLVKGCTPSGAPEGYRCSTFRIGLRAASNQLGGRKWGSSPTMRISHSEWCRRR